MSPSQCAAAPFSTAAAPLDAISHWCPCLQAVMAPSGFAAGGSAPPPPPGMANGIGGPGLPPAPPGPPPGQPRPASLSLCKQCCTLSDHLTKYILRDAHLKPVDTSWGLRPCPGGSDCLSKCIKLETITNHVHRCRGCAPAMAAAAASAAPVWQRAAPTWVCPLA